jgi:hypothetical protein
MSYYQINGVDANPSPGTIIAYLGNEIIDGWMLCNGQSVSRISFPELGKSLGVFSGSDFNLPNLQCMFLRGIGTQTYNTISYTGKTGINADTFKQHKHAIYCQNQNMSDSGTAYSESEGSQKTTLSNTGSRETRPYNYGVNWIIKTDLNPTVPGQPIISGVNLTIPVSNPGTTMNVNFEAPLGFDTNSTATSYQYSIDNGKTWTLSNLTNIPTPNYIKIRALNSSGNSGQSSSVYVIKTGLNFKLYNGYFADIVNTFFSSATALSRPYGTTGLSYSKGYVSSITNISDGTNTLIPTTGLTNFSVQWVGNLYTGANGNGSWSFTTASDDASYMWIGQDAFLPTSNNAFINNGGTHGIQSRSNSTLLEALTYYPIRIQFGQGSSTYGMSFTFTFPSNATSWGLFGILPEQDGLFQYF